MKIKSNELRIGNLVTDEYYNSFKCINKVCDINKEGIDLFIADDGDYPECAETWIEPNFKIEDIRGIPLTEEWLIKAGFERIGYTRHVVWCSDDFWDIKYCKSKKQFDIIDLELRDIKTVHRLQNVYFAHMEKELTFKN